MDSKLLKNKIDAIAAGAATGEEGGVAAAGQAAIPLDGMMAAGGRALAVQPGPSEQAAGALGAASPVRAAFSKMKLGDYSGADAQLARHLQEHPEDALAWRLLANSRLLQRRYEDSLDFADRALGLDARDARARKVKLQDYLELGRHREAAEEATRVLGLEPRDAETYLRRAQAYRAIGENEKYLADLKTAAELNDEFDADYKSAARRSLLSGGVELVRRNRALTVGLMCLALVLVFLGLSGKLNQTARSTPLRAEDRASAAPRADSVPQGFEIQGQIGSGGMGVVFKGFDLALQRPVAIKKMRDELRNERDRRHFLKEARFVANLRHPRIVDIFSVIEEGERLYLVFELLKGQTLDQALADKDRLSAAETLTIARQTGEALDYAHSQAIVHSDLKPANVFLTEHGVKVMDFGIARCVRETLSTLTRNEVSGTPAYMAPEQERGVVTSAADVYALGVCVYEMLAGDSPFRAQAGQWLKVQKDFTPLSKAAPGLPEAVDAVIGKALEPDPALRHRSARELVEDLARALNGHARA